MFTSQSEQQIKGIDDPRFGKSIARTVNAIGEQAAATARHLAMNSGSPPADDTHNRYFWVRIYGAYEAAGESSGYQFRILEFDSDGKAYLQNSDEIYDHLFDPAGNQSLMEDQELEVERVDSGSDTPRYQTKGVIPHAIFPVNVTKTGGSAGSKTTVCSYVYTVKTIDGAYTLGTGMAPLWGRTGKGKKTEPSGDQGRGYFDESGTFVLESVNEEPFGAGC